MQHPETLQEGFDMKELAFSPETIGNVPDPVAFLKKKAGRSDIRIVKRFIDARHKDKIKIIYKKQQRKTIMEYVKVIEKVYEVN